MAGGGKGFRERCPDRSEGGDRREVVLVAETGSGDISWEVLEEGAGGRTCWLGDVGEARAPADGGRGGKGQVRGGATAQWRNPHSGASGLALHSD